MKLNKKIQYISLISLLLIIVGWVIFLNTRTSEANFNKQEDLLSITPNEIKIKEYEDAKELIKIESGDTYGVAMARAGVSVSVSASIYNAAKEYYDLAQIVVGRNLELSYDYKTKTLKSLVYKIDSEEELKVIIKDNIYEASIDPISYETKIVTKGGQISSSLYQAALDEGIDERAIISLANAFQWTIDFALDPRVNDTFKLIYEERYLDGEYSGPGKVLAGRYVNSGSSYEVFYFDQDPDNAGYFDQDGNSVQKLFLKAPVAFKYISSGFTTGKRYVEAFNVSTGHRAVDYAAAIGTPIRSVGDGTITMAAWNGPYGNMVKVRHNGTYSTNYGHMSKMAVTKGQKVKQGDIIGYVGSTGFSTGPHLHYEMVKNGVKINPLAEVLPPGDSLSDEMRESFKNSISNWQEELES